MDVIKALKKRKSIRAFLQKEVTEEQINTILDAAKRTPSGVNTQPWTVAVVTGDSKKNLQTKIENAFREGDKGQRGYQYYPLNWREPYISRRRACGLLMYKTLGIKKEDKEKAINQKACNYRAFDAPVMLLFFIDSDLEVGSFMDYGMFLQSIMLAAIDLGLSTCALASLADYQHIIKKELGFSDKQILLCGMALGYEDEKAIINSYKTNREEVEKFTQYFR